MEERIFRFVIYAFYIGNVIIIIFSIGMITIIPLPVVEDMLSEYSTGYHHTPGNLMIASLIAMIIISAIGNFGVYKQKKWIILFFFVSTMFILIVLTIFLFMIFAKFSKKTEDVRIGMLRIISQYSTSRKAKYYWNSMHQKFECCGIKTKNITDSWRIWSTFPEMGFQGKIKIPNSCCRDKLEVMSCIENPNKNNAFLNDCFDAYVTRLKDKTTNAGFVGFTIIFFVIMVLTLSFIIYSQSDEREETEERDENTKEMKKTKQIEETKETKVVIEPEKIEETKKIEKIEEMKATEGEKETKQIEETKGTGKTKETAETEDTSDVEKIEEATEIEKAEGKKETETTEETKGTGKTEETKKTGKTEETKGTGKTEETAETEDASDVEKIEEATEIEKAEGKKETETTEETKGTGKTEETKETGKTEETKGTGKTEETAETDASDIEKTEEATEKEKAKETEETKKAEEMMGKKTEKKRYSIGKCFFNLKDSFRN